MLLTVIIVVSIAAVLIVIQQESSGGNVTGQYSTQIINFAEAIAAAEGSNTAYNNPGDLTVTNQPGAVGTFGAGILVFDNQTDGWNALYNQLQEIVNGTSQVYSLSDTIQVMANKWTATNPDGWAQMVAQSLGANTTDELSMWLS